MSSHDKHIKSDVFSAIPGFHDIAHELRELGPSGFTFALNFQYFTPEILHIGFPEDWLKLYKAGHFLMIDPVLIWASLNDGQKRWSDIGLLGNKALAQHVMSKAKAFDINYGAVVVCRNPANRKKCMISAARPDRELTDKEIDRLQEIMISSMESLKGTEAISAFDINLLELLAAGETQDEIANQLSMKRDAIKKRIERIRIALGAKNTAHAVVLAISKGLIKP